jgi:Phospholipase_D-nuclease N-terminal
MFFGLVGLLIFVLDIYVIYLIVTSSLETGMKLVWVIVVLLLPLLGPILYLVLGRGASIS